MTAAYQPIMVQIELNDYLEQLQAASFDRPSAFRMAASLLGIEDPRELTMHAWAGGDAERDYLHRVFAGNVPPVLMSEEWDT